MEHVELKQASIHEKNDCIAMMEAFYEIDNYPFNKPLAESCFQEFIQRPELGKFWLILNNKELAGYIILCFGFSFEYGGRDAFIDELYLKKDFRGKGVGTEALKLAVKQAKLLNVNAIHLEVESNNAAGKKLYEKLGYVGNNRKLLTRVL